MKIVCGGWGGVEVREWRKGERRVGPCGNLRREMKEKGREKEVFNITTVEVVKDS